MTSRHQESGSFKRPGAVYSVWLFGVSESSSTSWNRLRSFGVPGTAAPVSVDALRSLQSMSNHQWSHVCSVYPVKTWDLTASDSWWVPAFSTRCCGPSCRDHTDNIVRPPPDLLRHHTLAASPKRRGCKPDFGSDQVRQLAHGVSLLYDGSF